MRTVLLLVLLLNIACNPVYAQQLVSHDFNDKTIIIKADSACSAGDMDLIIQDFWEQKASSLLLSVENLLSGEEKVFSILDNNKNPEAMYKFHKEIIAGKGVSINGLTLKNSVPYLLRICKTSPGAAFNCLDKKSIPFDQAIQVHNYHQVDPSTVEDKVYFAQPFSVQNGKVRFLDRAVSVYAKEQVFKYFNLPTEKENLYMEVKDLGSLPFSMQNNTLTVHLPYYDAKRCKLEAS